MQPKPWFDEECLHFSDERKQTKLQWVQGPSQTNVVHQLFVDFKKAYDSIKREVLYNILKEFGIPMKLIRLIKMCLTETYGKVQVGKNLS